MLVLLKKKVCLRFHTLLYSLTSLDAAKEAYNKLCVIKIYQDNYYFNVELQPLNKNINPQTIALEFSNYVLSGMK